MYAPIRYAKSLIIEAPVNTVFRCWTDFSNFEQFISEIDDIEVVDTHRSRWRIAAPLGYKVEFESTVIELEKDRRMVWESHHDYGHARGELDFNTVDGNTLVDLNFEYHLSNPLIQKLAHLISHYGFPSSAFDHGLKTIKDKIELQGTQA